MGTKTQLAAATAIILSQSAFSADIETITVVGRSDKSVLDIPSNIQIIDKQLIQNSGATDVVSLVANQAGIQINDNNTSASISMRGFGADSAANNTLILVDGRRLNNQDISAPNLNLITLDNVERIEILSGSAGVLYGDQAVAGVINIITVDGWDDHLEVKLGGGSFNSQKYGLDGTKKVSNNLSVSVSLLHDQSDNYRAHNKHKRRQLDASVNYDSAAAHGYFGINQQKFDKQTPGKLTKTELEQDPTQVNPSFVNDYLNTVETNLRFGGGTEISKVWRWDVQGNYRINQGKSVAWGGAEQTTDRNLLELAPKFIASFSSAELITGIDVSYGDYHFKGLSRRNKQTKIAPFVHFKQPLIDTLDLNLGGRFASVSDDLTDANTYPEGKTISNTANAFELGLNYRPSKAQRLYARIESNYRFAKLDEQAYTSPGVVGLKPQTGISYEAGWDLNTQSQQLSINAYKLDLENEIIYDSNAPKPDGGQFNGANVNAESSTRLGIAASWQYQLSDTVNFNANYSYVDAKFTKGANTDKKLPWVSPHTAKASLNWFINDDITLFAEHLYTGERRLESDFANVGETLASYQLTNLALSYKLDALKLTARVENLFDTQYVSFATYSPWGNGYYPGVGSSLWVEASYRF
ncbi:TonB-dependent receptor [Paraferrimonas sp. SM1919]|uniref:TonB-dependent receptor n=1 Tax=Paraferrimonas sp. SM1919 TaxID=2662263 RepID=UPI0013D2628B|nr:TonB-dependent receptor [Paraferrimonas sp. SM1919]